MMLPSFPELTLNGVELRESSELIILGVTFDPKLSFEQHLRSVVVPASQRISIMRRLKIFYSVEVVRHCFNSFMLPDFEYASVVRGSAARSHLALLDRIVNRCSYLMSDLVACNLNNHGSVAGLCMLFKVRERLSHPLFACLPTPYRRERLTRRAEALNEFAFEPVRYRTNQYSRSFIPAFVDRWNNLNSPVFDGVGTVSFKTLVNQSLFG